jgi:hypothetical protein
MVHNFSLGGIHSFKSHSVSYSAYGHPFSGEYADDQNNPG